MNKRKNQIYDKSLNLLLAIIIGKASAFFGKFGKQAWICLLTSFALIEQGASDAQLNREFDRQQQLVVDTKATCIRYAQQGFALKDELNLGYGIASHIWIDSEYKHFLLIKYKPKSGYCKYFAPAYEGLVYYQYSDMVNWLQFGVKYTYLEPPACKLYKMYCSQDDNKNYLAVNYEFELLCNGFNYYEKRGNVSKANYPLSNNMIFKKSGCYHN